MGRTIEIRDVPEVLYRILEAHAAHEGMSLSAYLLAKLHQISGVNFPEGALTLAEMLERLQSREPVTPEFSTADAVRELRGPLPPD